MIRLHDETGTFLLSSYGLHLALGFKGEPDFIERSFNWAQNTGVIGLTQRLNWFYGRAGRLAYVCPKSLAAIQRGLALQFRWEIVAAKEVAPLRVRIVPSDDPEVDDPTTVDDWNEVEIDRLAEQRATAFLAERVLRDSFVIEKVSGLGPVYSVGRPGRAESSAADWA